MFEIYVSRQKPLSRSKHHAVNLSICVVLYLDILRVREDSVKNRRIEIKIRDLWVIFVRFIVSLLFFFLAYNLDLCGYISLSNNRSILSSLFRSHHLYGKC